MASGLQSRVTGTPTFFIDGARYDSFWGEDALTDALLAHLRLAGRDRSLASAI